MHTNDKPNTTANPNAEGNDLGQVGGRAKTKTTPKAKTVSQRNTLPPAVISEIHLIPLDRIEIVAQVRTEFDAEFIKELAADIEARGLLQPVLVTPIGDEKYRLVCGEQRVRAIRLLGQKAVPAVITKMADRDAKLAQLAENIQREDLNLDDRCNAVKWLHDELGSVQAVAETIKRSKSWVSKLLALTLADYSQRAKNLMADGYTEDLEILGIVNQAELLGYQYANDLCREIQKGMSRQRARDWLKETKEKIAEEKKATDLRQAILLPEVTGEPTKKKDKVEPVPFSAKSALLSIERELTGRITAEEILRSYSSDQHGYITDLLRECHEEGLCVRTSGNVVVSIARAIKKHNGCSLKWVAFLKGFMNCDLDLLRIIEDAKESLK